MQEVKVDATQSKETVLRRRFPPHTHTHIHIEVSALFKSRSVLQEVEDMSPLSLSLITNLLVRLNALLLPAIYL